ncbi:M20/M25/M40 family metallo-hydrolase [Mucilaginibacter sp. JRF]|uniref:M20/M25/M40 family metallo-hydrolase n=1 Tax=Mucilaginibacter sp. JRF TaxID=2780088 RepID=UPI00187F6C08|nr:M20/M25/M40 family metallo-hydrolase [Mucilaginibacter sp. JRF]MBE9586052.1 M20/M25/M40 family metallo-hydrolase [Mucilaginibacter sp. JRF]
MKKLLLSAAILFSGLSLQAQDSLMMRKIYDEALVNGQGYENLRYLCKKIGPRLSGSPNAQKAVEWGKKLMEEYGFDRVYLQEVMVPHWVRGAKEQGAIIDGKKKISVPICALGMSIATPAAGITANVIEVKSIKEMQDLGESVIKGKIVFFNRPFDPKYIETGQGYGAAGDQRFVGPAEAAKLGAVGAIVRSLSPALDDYPHTGGTLSAPGTKMIPAAAISTMAAEKLSRMLRLRKLPLIKFWFKQSCQTLPDAKSYNVIGELTGTENPKKVITVGGHLDSWDLAEGAHDDGTGIVQSAEALRILKALKYKPKNSVRAVFFMNEENGTRGGLKYAELAAKNKEDHIAAIETDEGGFVPRGFGFDASPEVVANINKNWKGLFEPYEADRLVKGEGGTDIEPLKETVPNITLISFLPDSQRYFDIHHTPNDVFENVHKRELELGSAAMASLIFLIDQHGLK